MLELLFGNLPMRNLFIALLMICGMAGLASRAEAEESGQFPGVYARERASAPMTSIERETLELKCVLAPNTMGADGFGVGYFLDTEAFRTKGTVTYIKGQDYRCRYNAATTMEICESREFSDGKSLHYYRTNIYELFTPEVQRGNSLMSPEDVANWNTTRTLNAANNFAYHRCKCPSESVVAALASPDANQLSSEETGRRLFWFDNEPTLEDLNTAREVMKTFEGCGGNVS
jgi:hypothetical protein